MKERPSHTAHTRERNGKSSGVFHGLMPECAALPEFQNPVSMNAHENQIVVYQPNETVRLDVRVENETVWLTQAQLCDLFGVVKSNISYHLKNIFGTNELDYGATVQKIRTVRTEAGRTVIRDLRILQS